MRIVLLVIDSLGVGWMEDVALSRPEDTGANTLLHVAERVGGLHLPVLERLGIGNILAVPGVSAVANPVASFGRCALGYVGADSYLGHQEIMGTIPPQPQKAMMTQVSSRLAQEIRTAGHSIRYPFADLPIFLVDEKVMVADNLESEPGRIITLTVPTSQYDFEQAVGLAQIVRSLVQIPRVNVWGGPGITVNAILSHVEVRTNGQIGVDSPALGAYNSDLVIRHLGYGVDTSKQLANTFARAEQPVTLYGKMADLVDCPEAERNRTVVTDEAMELLIAWVQERKHGLVAVNIQETDWAGHEQDAVRFGQILQTVDRKLTHVVEAIGPKDVLILTGDHGNDPTHGTRQHTREYTPLLWFQPGQPARSVGSRTSLADIAATAAHFAGISWSGDGVSFLSNGI